MALVVYNTLTQQKEEFIPLNNKIVKMYVCGITPYDETHLGHARCYITFDVIRRYLEYRGYKVKYVQNFTDIDDKIIKRSQELEHTPLELAQKYIDQYFKLSDQLNIKRADNYPKVTEHIPQIIKFVEELIAKGHAYVVEGDVYFSVKKFPDYGKLSRRKQEELKAGARVEIDEKKQDPLDFALWKKEKPGEISWSSPWGKGRPGWHIECSTMSLHELETQTLDIHGGGQDLIFPHHENEIAQSESYTGKSFAKYWLHNGFVTVNQEKMSKSLGNFFTLKEIFEKYHPQVVRLFLISQHYRHPIDFSDDKLLEAKKGLEKFYNIFENLQDLIEKIGLQPATKQMAKSEFIAQAETKFIAAMDDDFNTAQALAVLYEIVNYINKKMQTNTPDLITLSYLTKELIKLGRVLGLFSIQGEKFSVTKKTTEKTKLTKSEIEKLIQLREEYRKNNKWEEADKIRVQLLEAGIILEDTPFGARWKVK